MANVWHQFTRPPSHVSARISSFRISRTFPRVKSCSVTCNCKLQTLTFSTIKKLVTSENNNQLLHRINNINIAVALSPISPVPACDVSPQLQTYFLASVFTLHTGQWTVRADAERPKETLRLQLPWAQPGLYCSILWTFSREIKCIWYLLSSPK